MSSINISSNFSLFHSTDIQASESSIINSSNGLSEPVWLHSNAQDLILSTISGQGVSVLDATQIENVIHTWSCGSDVKYSFPSELIIDYNKSSENTEGSKGQVEITHDNLFNNEAMKVLEQGYTIYSVLESSNDLGSEDRNKVVWIQNDSGEKIIRNFDRKILKLKAIIINSNAFVVITFEDFTVELYERDLSKKIDELSFGSSSLFNQLFSINESFIQSWKSYKDSNFGLFTISKSSDSAQLIANIHSISIGSNLLPKFIKSAKSMKLPIGTTEVKKLILDNKTGNISVLDSTNSFTFFNLKLYNNASRYYSAWSSSSLIPSNYNDHLHVEYISSDFLVLITRDTDAKLNEPVLNLQVVDLKYGSIQFNSILTQSGFDAQASSNSDVESIKSSIANNNDILKFSFFPQFIKSTSSLVYQTIQIDRKQNTSELHRNIQVSCVLISYPEQSTLIDLVVNAQEEVYRAGDKKSHTTKHAPIIPCNRFFSTQYKLLSEWSDLEAELIPEIFKESDSWAVFSKHIFQMSKFLSSSMKQLGQNFPKHSKLLKRSFDDKLELFTDNRKVPLTQLDRINHSGSSQPAENLAKYSNDSISLLSQNFCATQSYTQLRKLKWDKIEDISPFITSHISPKYVESWIHHMIKMCEQDSTCPNMAVYNSELMGYFIRFSMVTSSTFRTSHQGILPMLLQRQDWSNIQTALVYTPDLSEYELVQLLMVAFETYLKFKKSKQSTEKSASLDHFIAYMNLVINYDYDPIYLTDALKALNIEQQENYFTQLVKLLDEHTNLLSHSAKNKFSKIQQFLTCFIDAHSLSLISQPNLQSLNKQLLQITTKAQKMLYRYQMFKSEMLGVVKLYKSEMIGAIHGKRTNEWLEDEEFDEKKENFLQSRYRRKKNYQIEALYL